VLTYDPGSRGSTSYVEAAREVAERGARMTPLSVDRPPGMPPVPPVAAMTFGGTASVDPSGRAE
jgi:chromosome partitioning protein